jgi:DNA adenine methylase
MKPFLRWAGSKRKLLPNIVPLISERYERYIEPFAGSACLFFKLEPKRAVLGDINSELMFTYALIRDQPEVVAEELTRLRNTKQLYYELRERDPLSLNDAARAARFIFLNRYCFNGLYRTNRIGQFNVPYGGDRTGTLPSATALRACSRALSKAKLVAADFETILKQVKRGDFVYLDPPFSVKARRVFNEYDAATFTSSQINRLREWMLRFSRKRITFLVSYAASEEAEYLRAGFNSRFVIVPRHIAGFLDSRRASKEVLIWNS